MGPIARKLVASVGKRKMRKMVNLVARVTERARAEPLPQAVASDEGLAALEPAHGRYVYVHNLLTVLVEQLSELSEVARLVTLINEAEDEYEPGGPPLSPLTTSYFTCWSMFDAWVGKGRETMASCVLALGKQLGMHPELLRLIGVMQRSRMGLYEHLGTDDGLVLLRELVTGLECRALSPAGYLGRRGELWLVRLLPPPAADFREHVAFTTPYLIVQPDLDQWHGYLKRTIGNLTVRAAHGRYERLMKYGPERHYWSEYIFEAYWDDEPNVIQLAGLPDVETSRPHSPVNW